MIKRYSEYKTAKFNLIENIPNHWIESKISYLFEIGRGRVISMLDINPEGKYPVYSSQTKDNGCMGFIDTYDFDDNILTWTTDGANAGTVFIRSGKFNCTNVCGTLKPKKSLDLKYFLYYLQYITQFYKRPDTNGAKIMNNEMAAVYSLIPTIKEQTQIARFLEHQTLLIDEIINRKEKQIELFKEKRQAVIYESVTKGLNPSVKMKDSGIEWLGVMPEHWKTTRMKFIASLKGRQGWQGLKADEYKDSGPYVVSSAHFNNYKIDWEKCPRVSQERYERDENIQLKQGDVLLMKDGANMGKLAMVENLPEPACLNSHLLLFRPLLINEVPSFYQKYLFYHMNCDFFQDYIYKNGTGSTFLGISQQSIGNYYIVLPPLNEQIEIANYIDGNTCQIDSIIDKEVEQIELLEEYRTALISEAVTGKIDVRDWQPNNNLN